MNYLETLGARYHLRMNGNIKKEGTPGLFELYSNLFCRVHCYSSGPIIP